MSAQKPAYSETVFQGKILDVRKDKVTLPDGRNSTMEVIYSNDATAVVALTGDNEVILINQYRYAAGGMLLEIPAGKIDPGESPRECARRELQEETGYRAEILRPLTSFYTTPGFCTERIHLFLAGDLTMQEQHLDQDEFIEVIKIPLEKAVRMVEKAEIVDAKTIVGLLTAAHMSDK